ncbi:MAG TPA: cardiolipin synthase [Bacillota bacterium]|nr:cardiolipin synthase [Bacillota bacterium]
MKLKGVFLLILLSGFFLGLYYHYLLEQLSGIPFLQTLSIQGNSPYWRAISYILTHFFTILSSLSIILVSSIIVLENRNPAKTVAWLLILTIFPVIGFIFYIFTGRNVRKKRRYKYKLIDLNDLQGLIHISYDFRNDDGLKDLLYKPERIIHLLLYNASSPMTQYNRVKVLTNGEETYGAMLGSLEKAKDHIHFISFIVRDDQVGREFKQLLIRKAKAGVKVRMIIDGLGSRSLPSSYLDELKEAGVEVYIFSPIIFPYLRKVNYRNHRKITIIDGKVGFVGGLNVGDEYLGKGEQFSFWRDTHMMLEGDSVYFLQMIFLMDWRFTAQSELSMEKRYFPRHEVKEQLYVQIAASGPDSDWEYIQKVYFSLITTARRTVYITTPYLIPDDSILMALKTAALSGVDVRIIVPEEPDHLIVFWASRSYYTELLEAGVQIYSYQKGFIHAKIVIVDQEMATLGTANFDIRSFQYNFEVSGVIYDSDVAKRLEDDFVQDMMDSVEIKLHDFNNRPFSQKAKESIARLMSPLL